MLRAALAVSGTVAGLAALFTFKTHAPGATPVAAPGSPAGNPPAAALAGTSPSAKPSTERSTRPAAKPSIAPGKASAKAPSTPTKAPATPAKAPAAPARKSSGQFEGPDVSTQYGPVQVVLSVSAGKITAANDAQEPADSIGANAIPQLNTEVLTAQSANIQAVSGATFTSAGYKQSLQQAIDQAGL